MNREARIRSPNLLQMGVLQPHQLRERAARGHHRGTEITVADRHIDIPLSAALDVFQHCKQAPQSVADIWLVEIETHSHLLCGRTAVKHGFDNGSPDRPHGLLGAAPGDGSRQQGRRVMQSVEDRGHYSGSELPAQRVRQFLQIAVASGGAYEPPQPRHIALRA